MKVVAACVAAVAALDCSSAFVVPSAVSTSTARSAMGRTNGAVRARSPAGLRMSAVSTEAMVSAASSLQGQQATHVVVGALHT